MKERVSNVMCSACREKVCRHVRLTSNNVKLRRLLTYIEDINYNVNKLNSLVEDLILDD